MKKILTILSLAVFIASCSSSKKLSETAQKCENIKVGMTFDELKKQEGEPMELEANEYFYGNMGSEVCDIKISDGKVASKKYSSVNP